MEAVAVIAVTVHILTIAYLFVVCKIAYRDYKNRGIKYNIIELMGKRFE